MRITVIHQNDYRIDGALDAAILSKESNHVPSNGDVIKVGHTLNGFDAYRVSDRVFRSKAGVDETPDAFQEVILVVDDV